MVLHNADEFEAMKQPSYLAVVVDRVEEVGETTIAADKKLKKANRIKEDC